MAKKPTLASLLGIDDKRQQVELGVTPQKLQAAINPNTANYRTATVATPQTNVGKLAKALEKVNPIFKDYRESQLADAEGDLIDFSSQLETMTYEERRKAILDAQNAKAKTESEVNKYYRGKYNLNPLAVTAARKLMGSSMAQYHAQFKNEKLEVYKGLMKRAEADRPTQDDIISFLEDTDKAFYEKYNIQDGLMKEGLQSSLKIQKEHDLQTLQTNLSDWHKKEVFMPNVTDSWMAVLTDSTLEGADSEQLKVRIKELNASMDILDNEEGQLLWQDFLNNISLDEAEAILTDQTRLDIIGQMKFGNTTVGKSNELTNELEATLYDKVAAHEEILKGKHKIRFEKEWGDSIAGLIDVMIVDSVEYDSDGNIRKITGGKATEISTYFNEQLAKSDKLPTNTREDREYKELVRTELTAQKQRLMNIMNEQLDNIREDSVYGTDYFNDQVISIMQELEDNKYSITGVSPFMDNTGDPTLKVLTPAMLKRIIPIVSAFNIKQRDFLSQTTGISSYTDKVVHYNKMMGESRPEFASALEQALRDEFSEEIKTHEDKQNESTTLPPTPDENEEVKRQRFHKRFKDDAGVVDDINELMLPPLNTQPLPKNPVSFDNSVYKELLNQKESVSDASKQNVNNLVSDAYTELHAIEEKANHIFNGNSTFRKQWNIMGGRGPNVTPNSTIATNIVYNYNMLLPARGFDADTLVLEILPTLQINGGSHYTHSSGLPIYPSTIEKIKQGLMPVTDFNPKKVEVNKQVAEALGISFEAYVEQQTKLLELRGPNPTKVIQNEGSFIEKTYYNPVGIMQFDVNPKQFKTEKIDTNEQGED